MEGVVADWWAEGWGAVGGRGDIVARMAEDIDGRKGDGHVVGGGRWMAKVEGDKRWLQQRGRQQ